MNPDRAVHGESPGHDTSAAGPDQAALGASSTARATGATSQAATSQAAAALFSGAPFEHATDAEMIERRVRTANPLMTPSPGPGASSTLRRDVLYALRTGGPASPDQVADRVGASRTGVLQQLRTLETAGLVTRSLSRHGVGRPRHVYDLTPAAQELFPANYGALTQSVLTAIRTVGGDKLIDDVFEARRQMLRARIEHRIEQRLPSNATLWERVKEVASYQDETGYLGRATRGADGAIHLSEHNCAIYGVSGTYQIACAAELQLFGEVLGAKVTRECHIASGGRSCIYLIEPADK
jgi:predicted ArsR family transcriptional regulator